MKKTLLITFVIAVMLLNFTIPAYAWNWYEDAKCEVAEYGVYVAEEGEIKIDAELDEAYLKSTKIESYEDEAPYFRHSKYYDEYKDITKGQFVAYVVIDTLGMYIYAEIEDVTIFDELDDNGNTGDCFQIYFDWCPIDVVHPSSQNLYEMYMLDGCGWAYGPYKSTYGAVGLQYLGWLSCDYKNNIKGGCGFDTYTKLGPDGTDSVLLETKLIEGGWACEWFVPWRDQEQKDNVVSYYTKSTETASTNDASFYWECATDNVFYDHSLGIGFQACDDSDIDNVISPGKEENVGLRFDQRKELGLSYWADYSKLADIKWEESSSISFPPETPSEPPVVNTSDSIFAIISALVVSGAGVVVFSNKKKY